MAENKEDQTGRIRKEVEKFFNENRYRFPGLDLITLSEENRNHVLNIGTSILCTKWKVGYPGGSFVQAVVNNDLMGAFGKADHINKQCIEFYCSLLYNISYVK